MHVSLIKYEKKKNLGNYEHEVVHVEVVLQEGESAATALSRAKTTVEEALR